MNVQVTQAELQEIVDLERDIAPKVRRIEELKEGVKALLISKRPIESGVLTRASFGGLCGIQRGGRSSSTTLALSSQKSAGERLLATGSAT